MGHVSLKETFSVVLETPLMKVLLTLVKWKLLKLCRTRDSQCSSCQNVTNVNVNVRSNTWINVNEWYKFPFVLFSNI